MLICRRVAAAVADDHIVAAVLVVGRDDDRARLGGDGLRLSLIHISEPTRRS